LTASSAVALAVVGLVIAALLADGRAASEAETNDGGAWLLNRSESSIGNVNRTVAEISSVANPFSGNFDVQQADGVVVVHDVGAGQAVLIDTKFSQGGAPVTVSASTLVRAAPGAVVLHDVETGGVWRFDREQFTAVQQLAEETPQVQTSPAGRLAVGRDGTLTIADPLAGTVTTLGLDGQVATSDDLSWGDAAIVDVTMVGQTGVVALDDQRLLVADGDRVSTFQLEVEIVTLQQPSANGSDVIAITADGQIVRINMDSGEFRVENELDGSDPLAPIVHGSCVWVVTKSPEPRLSWCGNAQALPGSGPELKLVLVNNWVWVNDVQSGNIYFANEDDQEIREISDWTAALSRNENEDETDSSNTGEEDLVRNDNAAKLDADLVDALDEDDKNTDPVAEDDQATTRRGRTVVVDVLANDFDEDNDPLAVEIVDVETLGTASAAGVDPADLHIDLTADGRGIQVRGPADFTGQIRFKYTVHDGRQGRATATVTIDVIEPDQASNRPPVANIDNGEVRAGQSVSLNVLANDTDPDGDALVLLSVGEVEGTLNFAPEGRVSYTPAAASSEGTVDLPYTIADEYGAEANGIVRIRVRPNASNRPPQARNDVGRTTVGRPVLLRVLDNDVDPDGDPLLGLNLQTADGSATTAQLTPDGRFLYRPEEPGTYLFTYVVSDGEKVDTAQIRVDVEATQQNRPPIAVLDEVALAHGESRLVRVLDNDADPDGDIVGIVDWIGAEGLEISEVPGIGFLVLATPNAPPLSEFTYWISDGQADAVQGSVLVSALAREPVDYPPIAVADVVDARPGQTTEVPVLRNDYDPEGRFLRLVGPLPALDEALVRISADGQVLLITVGEDELFGFSFGYNVQDPGGNQSSAVVNVRIVPPTQPNRPPIAGADVARTPFESPVTIAVLSNDLDPDGDPINIESIAEQPQHGVVDVNDDGTVLYRPNDGFSGTDSFVYTLVDGYQAPVGSTLPEEQQRPGRSLGEVFIGVMPPGGVNRDPSAVDDEGFAPVSVGGSQVQLNVLANDSDPDGDDFRITEVTETAVGIVAAGGNGQWVEFTPPADGEARQVSFSYSIADGRGGTDTAQVVVDLEATPNPLPPIAVDDTIGPGRPGDLLTFDPRDNDIDPDGPREELRIVGADAAIVVSATGVSITVPEETTDLQYSVEDVGGLRSAPAFITVLVAENRPPDVRQVTVETPFNEPVDINIGDWVSDPDEADELVITLGQNRSGGSVVVVGQPGPGSLQVRFTPDTDFEGTATFDFGVDDLRGHAVAGSALIAVLPPENREPTAAPIDVQAEAGVPYLLRLSENITDPDPDGQALHELSITAPAENNITLDGPTGTTGDVWIRSNVTDGGRTDSFTYTVNDDGLFTVSNTVSVTLGTPEFEAPSLTDDTSRTLQGDTTDPISVLDNDVDNSPADLRGDGLEIITNGVSANGQIVRTDDSFVFAPNPDFFGQATFTYTVQDGRRSTDFEATATVSVDVIGLPDQPQPPVVASRGANYLVVNWQAPQGNSARGAVEGYELRYTSDNGESGTIPFATPSTTYRLDGLTPGNRYCFTVAALNEAGLGDFSDSPGGTECETPNEPPPQPPPPTVAFDCGFLTINWGAPDFEGSAVTNYELRISGGLSSNNASLGPVLMFQWNGLTNGTDYTFEVRAENAEGFGPWSSFSAPEHPLCEPGAPPQPSAERGDRQVLVTWAAPADDGGDTITTYQIRSAELASAWIDVTPQGATNTYTWTSIANGTDITFEVRAINRDPDPGAVSPPSPVVRVCGVPDAPATPTLVRGDRQVTVSWVAPNEQGCAISGYVVRDSSGGQMNVGGGVTTLDFVGLTNGTPYTFTVAAINERVTLDGEAELYSPTSASVTPAGPPGFPDPVVTSATNIATRRVRVAWTVAGDNGDPITRYEIRVNGGSWTSVGNVTTVDRTEVSNGTAYSYRVRAVNGVGNGATSNQMTATTWSAPGTPNVSASAGNGTVSASWGVPSTGGTAFTSSVAKRITGTNCEGSGPPRWNPGTSESFPATNGTTYRVCVRYQNLVDWGDWGISNAVTPSAPVTLTVSRGVLYPLSDGTCSPNECYYLNYDAQNLAPSTSYTFYCDFRPSGGLWTNWRVGTLTTNPSGRATYRNGPVTGSFSTACVSAAVAGETLRIRVGPVSATTTF